MSLIRQIWLLLLSTLVLAAVGSVGVIVVSARNTLQTQLAIKNSDNAQALASTLSQKGGDAQTMELLMSAQFDTGFYRSLRLVRPNGSQAFAKEATAVRSIAPAWFIKALPIDAPPGRAQVSDGWRALGAIELSTQTAFAHDELWLGAMRAAGALAAIGVAAALIAMIVVGRIKRPLDAAVGQARSLVEGQFTTIPEPRIPELQRLTRAMNTMVARLKTVFESQAQQVEALRRQAHSDPLTGLANRKHFMGQLAAQLNREEGATESGLILMRVLDLAGVNRQLGHAVTDRMIESVAQVIESYTRRIDGCHGGRLNGSDFAMCLPVGGVAEETAKAIADALRVVMAAFGNGISVALGAIEVQRDRKVGEVMTAADLSLARAESRGPFAVEVGYASGDEAAQRDARMQGEGAWREAILEALDRKRMKLANFPLLDEESKLIHLECPLRVQLTTEGPFETGARWLPLAMRARLTALLDERAVELALEGIAKDGLPRCVNLSAAALLDAGCMARLRQLLISSTPAGSLLWLEVPESVAIDLFDAVQEIGRNVRPSGVRVGLEHAGERLTRIERLFEGGIDYVKLDAATVLGVGHDETRANYVKSLVAMLRGLSITVFAEGVVDAADARQLWNLGVVGITGPWASSMRNDLVG